MCVGKLFKLILFLSEIHIGVLSLFLREVY